MHKSLIGIILLISYATVVHSCSCGFCYPDETLGTTACCSRICKGPQSKRSVCDRHDECRRLHGQWQSWSPWGSCEVTCPEGTTPAPPNGGVMTQSSSRTYAGTQSRRRKCDLTSDRQELGGQPCVRTDGISAHTEQEERQCRVKIIGECVAEGEINDTEWKRIWIVSLACLSIIVIVIVIVLLILAWELKKMKNKRRRCWGWKGNKHVCRNDTEDQNSNGGPRLNSPNVNLTLLDGPRPSVWTPTRVSTNESGLGMEDGNDDDGGPRTTTTVISM